MVNEVTQLNRAVMAVAKEAKKLGEHVTLWYGDPNEYGNNIMVDGFVQKVAYRPDNTIVIKQDSGEMITLTSPDGLFLGIVVQ